MTSAVANRYARALADLVMAPGSSLKPEDAVTQLRAVSQMVAGSPELKTALLTPAIQSARKRAVMQKLMAELGLAELVRNFVFVIIDRRRVGILDQMAEALEHLVDERTGVARAEIVSAAALDAQRSTGIESELARLSGKRMRLRFGVDPALLGGVMARIGSTVYDGSLRGQLQEMRRRLTEQHAE